MKFFSRIPTFLYNKYFVSVVAFAVWILFFDRNDVFTQRQRRIELQKLETSKEYYTEQITKEKKALEDLESDPAKIERYAREKYLMKRDNEDLFLIQSAEETH